MGETAALHHPSVASRGAAQGGHSCRLPRGAVVGMTDNGQAVEDEGEVSTLSLGMGYKRPLAAGP